MNRIAMLEKAISFEIRSEITWHPDTQTLAYTTLVKLPSPLFDDGRKPVYNCAQFKGYILRKYADQTSTLLPGDLNMDLEARQIQT